MDRQGEERQLEATTVEVGTESSSHIPLLRSVFGGYRLHPKTWNPTGAAKSESLYLKYTLGRCTACLVNYSDSIIMSTNNR